MVEQSTYLFFYFYIDLDFFFILVQRKIMMAMNTDVKPRGDISSVFSHLGGEETLLDEALLQVKKDIMANTDRVLFQQAYNRMIASFEKETPQVQSLGPAIVPQVTLQQIEANNGQFPSNIADSIRKHGCVVIRNVVPEEEARDYKKEVEDYIRRHRGKVEGFPKSDPQVWEIYWSQAQVKARSHPGFEKAVKALGCLWHSSEDTAVDFSKNVGYCDRLRIRKPQNESFALKEHIDSGSLERWQDPEYRKCYTDIFNGNWENYDPFDATHRVEARMDYYNSPGGCSVFRNFQGWLAISDIKTGSGTLRVCPLLKQSTAYFLMKPLIDQYIDKNDYIGALPGLCQGISEEDYPHIINTMVSMPDVKPGDAVFWHCDQVHAVEQKNDSDMDSAVFYIPSAPLCRINSEYIKKQRAAFERGLTPPDFPGNHFEETFEDRAKPETISDAAKICMGIKPYSDLLKNTTEGEKRANRLHNEILDFV
ncbi:MAG: DUF1479 domain-containing protein [Benjaminiella poitrasii]|nr:MAG: DUF1479 domain-containing protein [Benjaminiella poitrasii]